MRTLLDQGVDELVRQGADGDVGPLGDVEDVMREAISTILAAGLAHLALCQGPQATQHTEQGGLARAIGPRDQQVGAAGNAEGEVADEGRIGRGHHCCSLECNLILCSLNRALPSMLACTPKPLRYYLKGLKTNARGLA